MAVLVGYASEHGSTKDIAEHLAARLAVLRHKADVRPLGGLKVGEQYDAFVLGSAVHHGSWLPDAVHFVRTHRALLSARPVWMFSVGMTAALRGPVGTLARRGEQTPVVRLRQLVGPTGYHRFSGVIRPEHLDPTGRLVFRLLGCRYGDYRDWGEIDAWADRIARELSGRAGAG